MKYKHISTTLLDYINEQQFLDDDISIPKTKLNGTFYHGSVLVDDDILFDSFKLGYSDWDSIWISDEESVADEFSEWRGGFDNEVRVVFRLNLDIDSIADISYDLFEEMNEMWALGDFRESIPLLKQRGFNGWVTTGSIDNIKYNDIAIFYPHYINIKDVKVFMNNDWTNFMDISKAQEIINDIINNR